MTKLIVILLLMLILASLGSALFFMLTGKGELTAKSLTLRIALSVLAFILLWIAYAAGWIQPHGVLPQ